MCSSEITGMLKRFNCSRRSLSLPLEDTSVIEMEDLCKVMHQADVLKSMISGLLGCLPKKGWRLGFHTHCGEIYLAFSGGWRWRDGGGNISYNADTPKVPSFKGKNKTESRLLAEHFVSSPKCNRTALLKKRPFMETRQSGAASRITPPRFWSERPARMNYRPLGKILSVKPQDYPFMFVFVYRIEMSR